MYICMLTYSYIRFHKLPMCDKMKGKTKYYKIVPFHFTYVCELNYFWVDVILGHGNQH